MPAPPRIDLTKTAPPVYGRLDEVLTVPVEVKGRPEPTVAWYLGRNLIQDDENYSVKKQGSLYTLQVRRVTEALGQGLTVYAYSTAGTDSRNIECKIYKVLRRRRSMRRAKSQTLPPQRGDVSETRKTINLFRATDSASERSLSLDGTKRRAASLGRVNTEPEEVFIKYANNISHGASADSEGFQRSSSHSRLVSLHTTVSASQKRRVSSTDNVFQEVASTVAPTIAVESLPTYRTSSIRRPVTPTRLMGSASSSSLNREPGSKENESPQSPTHGTVRQVKRRKVRSAKVPKQDNEHAHGENSSSRLTVSQDPSLRENASEYTTHKESSSQDVSYKETGSVSVSQSELGQVTTRRVKSAKVNGGDGSYETSGSVNVRKKDTVTKDIRYNETGSVSVGHTELGLGPPVSLVGAGVLHQIPWGSSSLPMATTHTPGGQLDRQAAWSGQASGMRSKSQSLPPKSHSVKAKRTDAAQRSVSTLSPNVAPAAPGGHPVRAVSSYHAAQQDMHTTSQSTSFVLSTHSKEENINPLSNVDSVQALQIDKASAASQIRYTEMMETDLDAGENRQVLSGRLEEEAPPKKKKKSKEKVKESDMNVKEVDSVIKPKMKRSKSKESEKLVAPSGSKTIEISDVSAFHAPAAKPEKPKKKSKKDKKEKGVNDAADGKIVTEEGIVKVKKKKSKLFSKKDKSEQEMSKSHEEAGAVPYMDYDMNQGIMDVSPAKQNLKRPDIILSTDVETNNVYFSQSIVEDDVDLNRSLDGQIPSALGSPTLGGETDNKNNEIQQDVTPGEYDNQTMVKHEVPKKKKRSKEEKEAEKREKRERKEREKQEKKERKEREKLEKIERERQEQERKEQERMEKEKAEQKKDRKKKKKKEKHSIEIEDSVDSSKDQHQGYDQLGTDFSHASKLQEISNINRIEHDMEVDYSLRTGSSDVTELRKWNSVENYHSVSKQEPSSVPSSHRLVSGQSYSQDPLTMSNLPSFAGRKETTFSSEGIIEQTQDDDWSNEFLQHQNHHQPDHSQSAEEFITTRGLMEKWSSTPSSTDHSFSVIKGDDQEQSEQSWDVEFLNQNNTHQEVWQINGRRMSDVCKDMLDEHSTERMEHDSSDYIENLQRDKALNELHQLVDEIQTFTSQDLLNADADQLETQRPMSEPPQEHPLNKWRHKSESALGMARRGQQGSARSTPPVGGSGGHRSRSVTRIGSRSAQASPGRVRVTIEHTKTVTRESVEELTTTYSSRASTPGMLATATSVDRPFASVEIIGSSFEQNLPASVRVESISKSNDNVFEENLSQTVGVDRERKMFRSADDIEDVQPNRNFVKSESQINAGFIETDLDAHLMDDGMNEDVSDAKEVVDHAVDDLDIIGVRGIEVISEVMSPNANITTVERSSDSTGNTEKSSKPPNAVDRYPKMYDIHKKQKHQLYVSSNVYANESTVTTTKSNVVVPNETNVIKNSSEHSIASSSTANEAILGISDVKGVNNLECSESDAGTKTMHEVTFITHTESTPQQGDSPYSTDKKSIDLCVNDKSRNSKVSSVTVEQTTLTTVTKEVTESCIDTAKKEESAHNLIVNANIKNRLMNDQNKQEKSLDIDTIDGNNPQNIDEDLLITKGTSEQKGVCETVITMDQVSDFEHSKVEKPVTDMANKDNSHKTEFSKNDKITTAVVHDTDLEEKSDIKTEANSRDTSIEQIDSGMNIAINVNQSEFSTNKSIPLISEGDVVVMGNKLTNKESAVAVAGGGNDHEDTKLPNNEDTSLDSEIVITKNIKLDVNEDATPVVIEKKTDVTVDIETKQVESITVESDGNKGTIVTEKSPEIETLQFVEVYELDSSEDEKQPSEPRGNNMNSSDEVYEEMFEQQMEELEVEIPTVRCETVLISDGERVQKKPPKSPCEEDDTVQEAQVFHNSELWHYRLKRYRLLDGGTRIPEDLRSRRSFSAPRERHDVKTRSLSLSMPGLMHDIYGDRFQRVQNNDSLFDDDQNVDHFSSPQTTTLHFGTNTVTEKEYSWKAKQTDTINTNSSLRASFATSTPLKDVQNIALSPRRYAYMQPKSDEYSAVPVENKKIGNSEEKNQLPVENNETVDSNVKMQLQFDSSLTMEKNEMHNLDNDVSDESEDSDSDSDSEDSVSEISVDSDDSNMGKIGSYDISIPLEEDAIDEESENETDGPSAKELRFDTATRVVSEPIADKDIVDHAQSMVTDALDQAVARVVVEDTISIATGDRKQQKAYSILDDDIIIRQHPQQAQLVHDLHSLADDMKNRIKHGHVDPQKVNEFVDQIVGEAVSKYRRETDVAKNSVEVPEKDGGNGEEVSTKNDNLAKQLVADVMHESVQELSFELSQLKGILEKELLIQSDQQDTESLLQGQTGDALKEFDEHDEEIQLLLSEKSNKNNNAILLAEELGASISDSSADIQMKSSQSTSDTGKTFVGSLQKNDKENSSPSYDAFEHEPNEEDMEDSEKRLSRDSWDFTPRSHLRGTPSSLSESNYEGIMRDIKFEIQRLERILTEGQVKKDSSEFTANILSLKNEYSNVKDMAAAQSTAGQDKPTDIGDSKVTDVQSSGDEEMLKLEDMLRFGGCDEERVSEILEMVNTYVQSEQCDQSSTDVKEEDLDQLEAELAKAQSVIHTELDNYTGENVAPSKMDGNNCIAMMDRDFDNNEELLSSCVDHGSSCPHSAPLTPQTSVHREVSVHGEPERVDTQLGSVDVNLNNLADNEKRDTTAKLSPPEGCRVDENENEGRCSSASEAAQESLAVEKALLESVLSNIGVFVFLLLAVIVFHIINTVLKDESNSV